MKILWIIKGYFFISVIFSLNAFDAFEIGFIFSVERNNRYCCYHASSLNMVDFFFSLLFFLNFVPVYVANTHMNICTYIHYYRSWCTCRCMRLLVNYYQINQIFKRFDKCFLSLLVFDHLIPLMNTLTSILNEQTIFFYGKTTNLLVDLIYFMWVCDTWLISDVYRHQSQLSLCMMC